MLKFLPSRSIQPVLVVFAIILGACIYAWFAASDVPQKRPLSAEQRGQANADMKQFLVQHYGGESANARQRALVERIGHDIVSRSNAKDSKKEFQFHLLAEPNAINSFAVPTGDVYVTTALVNRMRTEGELAAALSNGVAHVLKSDRMDMSPTSPPQFTVTEETAADANTVKLMAATGYDPQALLGMFTVLTDAYNAHADVPFFVTHPSADGRLASIAATIKALYPQGVPSVLSK